MSLAAFGCNPEDTGASLDDVGGHQPGTLAYSRRTGESTVSSRPGGDCSQYDTCLIVGNWRVRPLDSTARRQRLCGLCIPQVALANAPTAGASCSATGKRGPTCRHRRRATTLTVTADEGKLDDAYDGVNKQHRRSEAPVRNGGRKRRPDLRRRRHCGRISTRLVI